MPRVAWDWAFRHYTNVWAECTEVLGAVCNWATIYNVAKWGGQELLQFSGVSGMYCTILYPHGAENGVVCSNNYWVFVCGNVHALEGSM